MEKHFTMEYWIDDNWYVGRIKEFPSVFSQGETISELEKNICDAYNMVCSEIGIDIPENSKTKDLIFTI